MAKNDGSGHYVRGEKRVDITWGDKISESLSKYHEKSRKAKKCINCGNEFRGIKVAKYCSKDCQYQYTYNGPDKVAGKARRIGANLLLGKGKHKWLCEFVRSHIGRPCIYCGEGLDIDNMSLDHKDAYNDNKKRRNKAENRKHREYMDRKENLQLICRKCNSVKGSFDHDEFMALLKIDDDFPGFYEKMSGRLARGNLVWKRRNGQ